MPGSVYIPFFCEWKFTCNLKIIFMEVLKLQKPQVEVSPYIIL